MQYLSLLQNPRTRKAILDEWFPDWRLQLAEGRSRWVVVWQMRTGMPIRTSYRWYAYAVEIAEAEQIAA